MNWYSSPWCLYSAPWQPICNFHGQEPRTPWQDEATGSVLLLAWKCGPGAGYNAFLHPYHLASCWSAHQTIDYTQGEGVLSDAETWWIWGESVICRDAQSGGSVNIGCLCTSYCLMWHFFSDYFSCCLSRLIRWFVTFVLHCFSLFALFVDLKFLCPVFLLFSLWHWAQECSFVVYLNTTEVLDSCRHLQVCSFFLHSWCEISGCSQFQYTCP